MNKIHRNVYTVGIEVSFCDLYVGWNPLFLTHVFLTEGGLCIILFTVSFSKHNSELIALTQNLSQVLLTLDYAPKYKMTTAYCLRQWPVIFLCIEDFVRAHSDK
jgi:hypothetical protein